MMAGLTHSTVVVVPDDPTYPVGTDEWNDEHLFTGGAQGQVLLQGAADAITSSSDFTWDDAGKVLTVKAAGGVLFDQLAGVGNWSAFTKGNFEVEASGFIDFLTDDGGDIVFTSDGNFLVDAGNAPGLISLTNGAAEIEIAAAGDINITTAAGGGDITLASGAGGVIVPTRTGTPATDAVFDSAGVLCERALPVAAQPISWGNVGG